MPPLLRIGGSGQFLSILIYFKGLLTDESLQYQHHELPAAVSVPEAPVATVTQTVTVPAPHRVGGVASPAPEVPVSTVFNDPPRTTAVEIVTEEQEDFEPPRRRARRPPAWWGGW